MTPQQVADIATAAIAYRIAEKAFHSTNHQAGARAEREALWDAKYALYAALDAVLDEAMADLTDTEPHPPPGDCDTCRYVNTVVRYYNGDGRCENYQCGPAELTITENEG